MDIDVALVRRLIDQQFSEWQDLSIQKIEPGGWDNRTFRLGSDLIVRLPSHAAYTAQVAKEQCWLPRLAGHLPVAIPMPVAKGMPTYEYPWHWSVYRWIAGQTARVAKIPDLPAFAVDLAQFLTALQRLDVSGGPPPGPHNFYRGGSLNTYDEETRQALRDLEHHIDTKAATAVWEAALHGTWTRPPVWVHGDIHPTNLLVKGGHLNAVIDFGCLGVGDPACDLAIAWTFFTGKARDEFCRHLLADEGTWARARGWALWKAVITLAEPQTGRSKKNEAQYILQEIIGDKGNPR